MKKKIILIGFLILLVSVGAFVYFGQWQVKHGNHHYSGIIEAKDARLAFQTSGRVVTVAAKEGQAVIPDQILAELDATEFQNRSDQAQANLERSVKSVQQLETLLSIYEKTLPADVVRAEAMRLNARRVLDDARKNKERYDVLYQRKVVAEKERDAVQLQYDTAGSRLTDAEAALKQANSNLQKIKATKQDIEAAKAQARQAQAALGQMSIQKGYATLKAPFGGIITSRNIEPGEVVSPSREVLSLADLSRVDLKIFVDETEIGKVKPGQAVDVKIDTFPDRVFKGTVAFISPEGEFTPKIIQTQKERVKLVYLVKVSIPNPDFALKTGMPADAWLR